MILTHFRLIHFAHSNIADNLANLWHKHYYDMN